MAPLSLNWPLASVDHIQRKSLKIGNPAVLQGLGPATVTLSHLKLSLKDFHRGDLQCSGQDKKKQTDESATGYQVKSSQINQRFPLQTGTGFKHTTFRLPPLPKLCQVASHRGQAETFGTGLEQQLRRMQLSNRPQQLACCLQRVCIVRLRPSITPTLPQIGYPNCCVIAAAAQTRCAVI